MSRPRKIALIVGGSLLGLVLILAVAAIITVRTDWFRETVRQKIVATVEESTGGRVEIGSFAFDWTRLRAVIRNFVLHGTEPAGAAPLFRANTLEVRLKLTSPFTRMVDISYLGVDTPQANVIVFPDGRTNVPSPKVKKASDKSGLETVVDLAIGRFELNNGSFTFGARKADFNATGENLRAQLQYNPLNPRYTGEVRMNPLYMKSGANERVAVDVRLPVTLERDRIAVADAQLTTAGSRIVITGNIENLTDPRATANIDARVSIEEARRVAGLDLPLDTSRGPGVLVADIDASMGGDRVNVRDATITLGQSRVEASGTLKDPNRPGSLKFEATLALGELGRMMRSAARPEGAAHIGGNATLGANNDYRVTANVDARNVAITQGGSRLTGIQLDSSVTAVPGRIEVGGLRLAALGGSLTGSGAVENMNQFRFSGNVQSLDIAQAVRAFSPNRLGYRGVVSGPVQAQGSIKDAEKIVARANLNVAPGGSGSGVPISGRLNAEYNGAGDTIVLGRSYLQLPNSRIDLSGSLGQRIEVHAVTRNLADFRPVGNIPVELNGGSATVDATITGKLSDPRIAGKVAATNLAVSGRQLGRLTASLNASKSGASLSDAVITNGTLQARLSGSVGLRDWKPAEDRPLRLDGVIRNADMRDILALAGQSAPVTGTVNADAHIAGTVGDPRGNADLTVTNGTVQGEPFNTLTARVNMTERAIDVPALSMVAGQSRLQGSANYQHPPGDLKRGVLTARIDSNRIQLAQFQSLVKGRPGLAGAISLTGDMAARVQPGKTGTEFELTAVNANVSARGLALEGKSLGDLTAVARTAGQVVQYDVNSNFAGSSIRVDGQSLLTGNHETRANAAISDLPIEPLLALAGRRNIPVSGTVSATGRLEGTLDDPRGTGSFQVSNGRAYQERFDRLQGSIRYAANLVEIPSLRYVDGPATIELSASLAHPPGDFRNGQVKFDVKGDQLTLARFESVQRFKPGLTGAVELAAAGAATLRANQAPLIAELDADIRAKDVAVQGRPIGSLNATAQTRGRELGFKLTSDFTGADIRGSGSMQLAGDYPVDARVAFDKLTYSGLRNWLGGDAPEGFEATVSGEANVAGPVTNIDLLRGAARLSALRVSNAPTARVTQSLSLANEGDIVVALDKSVVTVKSFRITGPGTTLAISGSAGLRGRQAMNLRAKGNVQLDVLESFNPDLFASGAVALDAAVTGTAAQPSVNGKVELRGASLNMINAPNGISNANGSIEFTGREAVIHNITGQSGGGKITLGGIVAYGGAGMRVRMQATADNVRVNYPGTVSTAVNAKLSLLGTSARSVLSGDVTIQEVALYQQSDIGSMLSGAAAPPSSPTPRTGFLGGVRFDVRVRTASDVQFRTALTQNLAADADLNLRGTIDDPGMLGAVNITRGELIFFGSRYDIQRGSIRFNNPSEINPNINIDLATRAQGIDVGINVSGPMRRLKLTYHSDPPMLFSDLVSLLASGRAPTTDPVLAARQPTTPQQSFQQAGASALLGQAANPVSGRLERLFGVSRLKIDPQITGATNTPQATLTLQQQITRDLTFTYIQDVTESNPQAVRIEWAINPRWSAIAQRDLNGMFDVDLFYRTRFR